MHAEIKTTQKTQYTRIFTWKPNAGENHRTYFFMFFCKHQLTIYNLSADRHPPVANNEDTNPLRHQPITNDEDTNPLRHQPVTNDEDTNPLRHQPVE
jgi:hypothetical protein